MSKGVKKLNRGKIRSVIMAVLFPTQKLHTFKPNFTLILCEITIYNQRSVLFFKSIFVLPITTISSASAATSLISCSIKSSSVVSVLQTFSLRGNKNLLEEREY